jgi:hypothetical protein
MGAEEEMGLGARWWGAARHQGRSNHRRKSWVCLKSPDGKDSMHEILGHTHTEVQSYTPAYSWITCTFTHIRWSLSVYRSIVTIHTVERKQHGRKCEREGEFWDTSHYICANLQVVHVCVCVCVGWSGLCVCDLRDVHPLPRVWNLSDQELMHILWSRNTLLNNSASPKKTGKMTERRDTNT